MTDVIVIGGANLDIKAKTLTRHVAGTSNPAAIVTKPGGVGRNIAHNLSKLGAKVALISAIGNDSAGDVVLKATAAAGVKTGAILKCAASTGTYLAVLDRSGELVTAVSDMRAMEELSSDAVDWEAVEQAQLLVVDCNISQELMFALAARAAAKMVVEPVSVAKCVRLAEALGRFPIFLATPNLDQLHALTGTRDCTRGADKMHAMGLRNVVIHAGAEGAFVSDGKMRLHLPVMAQNVIDVTGAGDAATAGLVAGILRGSDLFTAAKLGQEIAARVVASHNSTLE